MRWLPVVVLLCGCVERRDATVLSHDLSVSNTSMPGRIVIASTSSALSGSSGGTMRFGAIRDLWIRVVVPSIAQTAHLRLGFVNPIGERFYEDDAYYSLDPSITTINVPEVVHPVSVLLAASVADGVALDRSVPIAGGAFQRVPQPGRWSVDARLDGVDGMLTAPMDVAW